MRRNGCYNRVFETPTYKAQDGYHYPAIEVRGGFAIHSATRQPKWVDVPHRMTNNCNYDKRATDTGCTGCEWITNKGLENENTI